MKKIPFSVPRNDTRKQRRVISRFLPVCYLLALGPSPLPHLQVGFIADHRLLTTQRWHLVLIQQKPQALQTETEVNCICIKKILWV